METRFRHNLVVSDIVIREDENNDGNIGELGGNHFPLIRVRDTTIGFADINSVRLNIKIEDQLLPTLTISLDDNDFTYRDTNFIENGDIITIFLGKAMDSIHTPIKNNYLVTKCETIGGSYNLNCVLDVPTLYERVNRVFVKKSSIDVLEHIARESNLGFITNINESNDIMDWVQFQNNIDFIDYITKRSFIDFDTKIYVFVDQFANLNVIDIKKALEVNTTTTYKITNEGIILDSDEDSELRITNGYIVDPNSEDYIRTTSLDSYTPRNLDGYFSRRVPSKLNCVLEDRFGTDIHKTVDSKKEQLIDESILSLLKNTNTFDNYELTKYINEYNNHILKQRITLDCDFYEYIQQISLFLSVPIDIYDTIRGSHINTDGENNPSTTFDELNDDGVVVPLSVNSRFSGLYMACGMTIKFVRRSDQENKVIHNITFIKK